MRACCIVSAACRASRWARLFYGSAPTRTRSGCMIGVVALAFVGLAGWRGARGWIRLGRSRSGPVAGGIGGRRRAGSPASSAMRAGRRRRSTCSAQRLDKTTFQATTVLVFWAINLSKFGALCRAWASSPARRCCSTSRLPRSRVLGTWIGVRAHRAISDRVFFGLTYVLLTVTGAQLIWDRADAEDQAGSPFAATSVHSAKAWPVATRQVMPAAEVIRIVQVPVSDEA